MDTQPTVFHITHLKAGSQWVAEVLKHSAPDRFVPPQPRIGHVRLAPLQPGGVYPTVYLTRLGFDAVLAATRHPYRAFVVVRDLRDTLVSLYFSQKISHALTNSYQHYVRERLRHADQEEGLLLLIDQHADRSTLHDLLAIPEIDRYTRTPTLAPQDIPMALNMALIAEMQLSWVDADAPCIRYEDLVDDEYAVFEHLIAYCEIDVPRARLHEIIRYNTFEAITGRQRGQEDPAAHQRKGIAGDWRNHFTERVKEQFKETFGQVLIRTGYETDLDW